MSDYKTDIDDQQARPEPITGEVVNLKHDIIQAVNEYAINVFGVDNACKLSDNQFCGLLMDIHDRYIYNTGFITKEYNKQGKPYSSNNIGELIDIYIKLCMIYDKYCYIRGFSLFSGIDDNVIFSWGTDKKASSDFRYFYKKLMGYSEESLVNNLATGRKNPVGNMGILNNRFQWATSNNRHEYTTRIESTDDIAGLLGVNS